MNDIKEKMEDYLIGQISKHQINAQVFLKNPVAVADHPDLATTLEEELGKIAEYQDKLIALKDLTSG
tara:strand:- start:106 stop:306 length:201 start_codon:yes stop_codon:yes gene_type:complete